MPETPGQQKNYYEILGVFHTATPKEVEAAFRRLAQKWHPDVCPDVHQAATNFKRIAEAYEVLGDPEKRRCYDEAQAKRRRPHVPGPAMQQPASVGSNPANVSHLEPRDIFSQFHAIVGCLLRSGWAQPAARPSRTAPGPRSELDVEAALPLTPEEAHGGGAVQFKLRFRQTCPECVGRGRIQEAVCGTCGGQGTFSQGPRFVTVNVPAGVWTGSVIRISGEGKSSPGLRPPGDLVLYVQVRPSW